MTAVDLILDQSDAADIKAMTFGLATYAADMFWFRRPLTDDDRFALWAASTAAHARLIELRDVQRIKSDAAMSRWVHAPTEWDDGPVGEIPPDWQHLMGASVTARRVA